MSIKRFFFPSLSLCSVHDVKKNCHQTKASHTSLVTNWDANDRVIPVTRVLHLLFPRKKKKKKISRGILGYNTLKKKKYEKQELTLPRTHTRNERPG